jgi:hypothetical protein
VQFGNWPDAVYHSSDDSPAMQDPTQMKRSAFIMLTVANVIAGATPSTAAAVAGISLSYGERRIAADVGNALGMIAMSTKADLDSNYKEALNVVKQAYVRERLAVHSATALAKNDNGVAKEVGELEQSLVGSEPLDEARVKIAYRGAAQRLGTRAVEAVVLSDAEKAAARQFPTRKAGVAPQGGGRGGAGAGAPPPLLSGYYTMEARNWADGQHSVLDIRNALAAEFGPVPLENVMGFFKNDPNTYSFAQR